MYSIIAVFGVLGMYPGVSKERSDCNERPVCPANLILF